MEQYVHLLIPTRFDYVPQLSQVSTFIRKLQEIGSAPLQPTMKMRKVSGYRTGRDPMTGEPISVPKWSQTLIEEIPALDEQLAGLDEYDVTVAGQGPPSRPAFPLRYFEKQGQDTYVETDFPEIYDFSVRCCLRKSPVSMSTTPENSSDTLDGLAFGEPCPPAQCVGKFVHPVDERVLEVPGAGCARFWIEFEFGKFLFPHIEDNLNLLEPEILRSAKDCFASEFVQGCRLL